MTIAPVRPTLNSQPSAHPATRTGRRRLTVVAISVAVVALPLLRPSGPGNTGAVDLALLGAVLAAAMWASARSHVIRLPYAIPVGLTMVAGALAATLADTGVNGRGEGLIALAQDMFVLVWAGAIATVGQDRQLLDVICRAWAYSAVAWAAVLIIADLTGQNWLSGVSGADGIRASLTLGDPNLAADYFICGLLVIRATRRPRATGWRWFACALVVTAVVLTLSNGGMLALIAATTAGWVFGLARRRGLLVAGAAAALLAIVGTVAFATINLQDVIVSAEQASPLARDSIGREAESGGSRSTLTEETARMWFTGQDVLGLGPGNTQQTLRSRQAPYVKEAHNDYLAAILERGVLGGLALVALAVAVAVRARRIARPGGVDPPFLEVVPRPELLAAAIVAIAVSALFYEVLHFRHVWALLGLVAALELSGRRR
jgi:cell division protein FtsW (lipid II flippase)